MFSIFVRVKGFKMVTVSTEQEFADAMSVRHDVHTVEEGWSYPAECSRWIDDHYKNATIFLTYYQSEPIATVAIFDPKYANRLYDGFGINQDCEYHEIGGLAIKKDFRSGQMLVLLSIYCQLYRYSTKQNIHKWIALSSRVFVRGVEKLVPTIEMVALNLEQGTDQAGVLYHKAMLQFVPQIVCYKVNLRSISLWYIAKQAMRYTLKESFHKLGLR